jgi:hypothetical protein
MAVISVPSSATGATYSVRIAGDTPTAAEQARIDAYVAQMDATMAPVAPPPEDTGPDTSFAGALRFSLDQPLENMAVTSRALGGEGIASFLSGLTEAPTGYQPAFEGFMNEDGSFFDFSYLPRAAVEQTGQVVGSVGTRAAGALLGGAAGSVIPGVGTAAGAVAGGFAGPALFEAVQVLGPVALERARNNGREEPNAEDWLGAASTAAGSGALNAIAPGMSGFFKKTIVEAGTEGLQSVIQQAGETAATDVGLQIDPRQAAAEAILGGTAAGAISAPFAIAESRAAKRDAAKKADEKALKDLEEDQKEEAEDAAKRIAFGDAAMAPPPAEIAPEKPKMPETTSELISTLVSSRARPTDTESEAPSAPLPPVPGALQLPSYSGIQAPSPATPVAEAAPPTQQAPTSQPPAPVLETLQRARERQVAGSNQLVSKKGAQRLADAGLLAPEDIDVPVVANTKVSELLALGPEEITRRIQGTQPTQAVPPAPTTPAAGVGTAPTPESLVTPDTPRPPQPFRWRDYTAATQAVVNAKDASVPAIQKAASADPKKPAPPAVAKAIRDRMVADGVIVADKKSKGGFRVVPTRVPDVDQTESYRRTLDDLQQDAQDATAAQQKALLDARRADQTGSKAEARKFNLQADAAAETLTRIQATRQEVEARLPRAAAEVAVPRTEAPLSPIAEGRAAVPITEAPARAQTIAVSDRAKRLKQSMDYYQREAARKAAEARRLRESGKKVQLPKSDQQRMLDLERDAAADSRMAQAIRGQLARPAADIEQDRAQKAAAVAKEASDAAEAAARAPIYTEKEGQLFTAFRRRLDNLGLSDVKLVAERVIRPANAPQNALVEGMMDVDRRNGNRIIALALGVYDPKMTQQELFDAISGVMNHEVIHAIRSLGLFTDGEWKTLSDLAARQRYMKAKDGKSVERSYTYLQRSQQMYADSTPEIQSEEAVAEMFRDYVAGRLKIGGKPKTLMDRIKGFFKALWGAHAEAGLTDPNAIFEGVRFGDIGRRERKAEAAPDGDARLSRLIATDNPGGEWLKNKQRRAEQDMRTADPGSSSSKGITGSITAYMPKPVNLPVNILSSLTGANDEVRRPGDARYDELAADVARRGFVPDQDGNAVVVGVNHLGQAYLKEGNTRVAVARDFGVPSVRAEVRWFNGGELADGPFSPAAVEQIASGDARLSMVKLSDKDRKLTVLDRYEQGRFRDDRPRNAKGIPVSTRSKESAMVRLQADRGNKVFEPNEPNKKVIARLMAAEAEAALNSDRSAIGWYDAKLRAAKSVLALLHPEIATDPGANAAMDYATAVTSNGMAVVDNYRAANEQYEYWQKNGKFLVRGYGNQGKSMEKAFSFYNKLKDRGMSDSQISDYLSQDTTVAELRKNDIIRELGIEIDSKEFAAAKVKVSYVIGPKIGQGFYQNLRGNFEPLTMDRWWMRMFNRLTGNPFVVVTDETLKNNADRVVLSANEPLSDYEREVIEQAKLNRDIDMVTEGNALEFAKEVDRIFQKAYKDADEGQRPEKTRLFLAAGRYKLNSAPQLEESPRGPGDRQFMRETTNVARKYLKDATGVDITPADLQALLWYAEKRLWDSLGIRKGQGEDNDYVDGAIALLRNKGYGDDSILEALPAGERFRIDPVRYPAGQDGSVRGPDAEGDTAQAEARFSAIPTDAGEAGAGRGDGRGGGAVRGTPALEGSPVVQGASGPDQNLVLVAEKYARENGIDLRRQGKYVEVDEELATRIANAFDEMRHDPQDPKVKAAYAEVIRQTRAQYDALADAGYKFWFIDGDNPGEYASSPFNAMRDLRANRSMGVFPTESGFGTREEVDVSQNPLLEETDLMWPYGGPDGTKVPVLANDLFRAVHDAFGHGIEGSGFRARGEENAWQAHIRLFTGLAKGALTTETRGQNSWLNYGPFGEQNRNAKVEDTIFADQKVGLMPEWTWKEGLAPDGEAYSPDARMSIRYAVSPSTAAIRRNIQSNQKDLMYARSSDVLAGLISKTRLVDEKAARRFTDGVLRRFQDSMIPIGRMVQELSSRGMTIVDAMDPYLQEMLMHGVVGNKITTNQKGLYEPVANAIKRINVPQAKIDQLIAASNVASKDGKGYVSLAMKQGDSPRMVLADAYLYARHAVERNRYIKANKDKTNDSGSGMTDAEANAILQWFKSLDANNTQALADIAKGIRLIVADTNHNRVDGGLIATDTDDPYNFYVPLRGVTDTDSNAEEDSFSGQAPTRSLGARGREDRRALGRSGYAADLVANVFSQNQNAILRSESNKVGQSLLRLLRADPAKTKDFAEVLPFAPKTRAQLSDARVSERRDPSAYDEPDILVVKENGKEVFVRFEDPIVAGAMNGKNGFSPGSSRALLNAMQRLNSYLATINTSYNPEYVISNMARDLTTAGVNINQFEMDGLTSEALKNLKPALVGLKRSIINKDDSSEWAKIYKDFAAAGGQNVTNTVSTLADQMANIQSILGDISDSGMRGKWNSVKNSFVGKGVGSILNTMENINTVVENGIRVATYKAMIDRGVSKQRAAQAARNITVNFAKGGDYRQFMGAWSLFYNASIQGSFALINAATRSKRVQKIWLGAMAAGFLMDQLNSLLSDEDDEGLKAYDQLEDYVLEHNFVIIDPLGISERGYITIPMPYGLNVLYNAGRSISAVGRGKDTAGEATSNIFRTFVDSFNPIGGYDSFYKLAAPTIADPFVELSENKDFAGRNIYKEALPFDKTPAPDSQMYWTTTSPSAVWISNTLNSITGGNEVRPGLVDVSPNVLEYWFDLVTGGVGKFVQRTVESPLAIAEEGFTEEVIRDIPLLRKVVGSVSSREDMGTYIDGAKAILTAGEELKRAREVGDAAWARQTIQRYEKELRLVGPIKSFESALRETAKMRNQINANPNIPDEQRKVLLDRIEERRQMILKRANALIRGAGL